MPCLHPVSLLGGLITGIPCGRCSECCKKYSMEWTQRIMDEFKLAGENGIFVTLTYDDEHLPGDRQLRKEDLQKFFKRLRKAISPVKIRYFACGEYGGKLNRPHYHAIIFGWKPSDLRFYGHLYGSDQLARIWSNGYVSVGDITMDSAKYTAKYMAKADRREHAVKPFTTMSRKPGLGALAVTPPMALTGERFIQGQRFLLPKYYIQKLEELGLSTVELRRCRSMYLDSMKKMTAGEFEAYAGSKDRILSAYVSSLPLTYNQGTWK